MLFKSNFIYDDGAAGNGGGGEAATKDDKIVNTTDNSDNTPPAPQPFFTPEELTELGFDNEQSAKEAFKATLAEKKQNSISQEEKDKQANIDKGEFYKSAAQNGFKVDELNKYESLQSKADRDLVFEKHVAEFKEDNPEITDPAELEAAAKEDFEREYKITSGKESEKKRGESRLSKEANEIRNPYTTTYNSAKEKFTTEKEIAAKLPEFNKFVDELITANTPDKVVLFKTKDGEGDTAVDVDIEIELTQKERDAIAKEFKTPKTFNQFLTKKPEEIKAAIDKKIQGWIKVNKFDEVNKKTFDIAMGLGTKKGSNVGAQNLYALQKDSTQGKQAVILDIDQSNAKIAEARQRIKG